MKTSSTMVFVSTTALTGALVLGGSLQGCRSETLTSGGAGGATSATSGATTSTGVGEGGPAEVVTIQQIVDPTAAGHVGPSTAVKVVGAVAMSIKFLVSHSKTTNACLWGVFLSAPNLTETAANTGILALSYGTPATSVDGGTAYCPTIQANQPAGDAFPDDTAPGDVLDVIGETDSYIPAACAAADAGPGASSVASLQLDKVTSATKTGTATPPTPYVLGASDLASLAGGTDATWLTQWGSVRVELDNVSVVPYGSVDGGGGHARRLVRAHVSHRWHPDRRQALLRGLRQGHGRLLRRPRVPHQQPDVHLDQGDRLPRLLQLGHRPRRQVPRSQPRQRRLRVHVRRGPG
jgi:hypothetical protein